jgi:hypothetical protein
VSATDGLPDSRERIKALLSSSMPDAWNYAVNAALDIMDEPTLDGLYRRMLVDVARELAVEDGLPRAQHAAVIRGWLDDPETARPSLDLVATLDAARLAEREPTT